MKDLLTGLIEGRGYAFKEPWRAGEKSLTLVVPIVATTRRTRGYVILEEVKDRVEVKDTGSIGGVQVKVGDVDKPVFIRGGTMLKGATQERATQFGFIAQPQKTEVVEVHCIHASKGIRPEAAFQTAGYVPRRVHSAMMAHRSQTETWQAVSSFAMASTGSWGDDLVGAVKEVERFRDDLKDVLIHIPDHVDQVGAVIIDTDGVLGLELYDHPDSWKAFSKEVMRTYGDALLKQDQTGIFQPKLEAVTETIHTFIRRAERAEEEEVHRMEKARTVLLKAEGLAGEFTELNGATINLILTRTEGKRAEQGRERRPTRPTWINIMMTAPRQREPQTPQTAQDWIHSVLSEPPIYPKRRKGLYPLLDQLEQPKTWTSLKSKVPMSQATLASKLSQLQQAGAVEKQRDDNGITRYTLTGYGHYLREKKEVKSCTH